jgi:hypothetical protein
MAKVQDYEVGMSSNPSLAELLGTDEFSLDPSRRQTEAPP